MSTLMTPFKFEKPTSLNQVFDLVAKFQKNNQPFIFAAGNTDLLPMFKKGINLPDYLISLTALDELRGISMVEKSGFQQNRLRVGALTQLTEILHSKKVKKYFPELARVAGLVASPPIRNQATIGGNLLVDNRCIYINQNENNRSCHSHCFKAKGDVCHLVKSAKLGDETLCQARFVSDTAAILMLLDTNLILQNVSGTRCIPIKEFYRKDGIESSHLTTGEILIAIEIPIDQNKQIHYEKLTIRKTLDFPSIGVAMSMTPSTLNNSHERDFEMEISLIGIQTLPGYLRFSSVDFENIKDLLEQACSQANQFSLIYQQDFFPRAYRKKMIKVFIRRCFKKLREV